MRPDFLRTKQFLEKIVYLRGASSLGPIFPFRLNEFPGALDGDRNEKYSGRANFSR